MEKETQQPFPDRINNRHSGEIAAIITKVPAWILRWGITLFAAILLMALSVSTIIRYPDTLQLPLKVITGPQGANAMVMVGQNNYAKMKAGQPVMVMLQVYPSRQFRGAVIQVPAAPEADGRFRVLLKLENSPPLVLKDWMTGQAKIMLSDRTVLQRIVQNISRSVN